MQELIIFLLFVYSLTYLFVNDEYIFSKSWTLLVLSIHLILDKIKIFTVANFIHRLLFDFIAKHDNTINNNKWIYLSPVDYSEEFLSLKSCFTCAAFWVSFITSFVFTFSILNGVNLIGYFAFSIIVTVFLTHIYKIYNYLIKDGE